MGTVDRGVIVEPLRRKPGTLRSEEIERLLRNTSPQDLGPEEFGRELAITDATGYFVGEFEDQDVDRDKGTAWSN